MYHLLRRHQSRQRVPTPEAIGRWVRRSIFRGLICSGCGNMTDEDDVYCGDCGSYLNASVDAAVARAVEVARGLRATCGYHRW